MQEKKALQENTVSVKNTPVTITEPRKNKWLSSWDKKIDMVETVFLGVGRKKGPLGREQYVHVLRLLPGRISLYPTSLFTQPLCKMFTSTPGTDAGRPNARSGVRLPMVHSSEEIQQQGQRIMKWKGI